MQVIGRKKKMNYRRKLRELLQQCPKAGDFNDILNANEKRGGTPLSIRKCDIFNQIIKQFNLMDIGFTGH